MRGEKANLIALKKIVNHCDEISQMCRNHSDSKEEFESNIEFQYACGMCIVQIGELVSRLDEEFMYSFPDVPWRQLKGLRNIYAHDYERIDNDMIWETVTVDIPEVRKKIGYILNRLEGNSAEDQQ